MAIRGTDVVEQLRGRMKFYPDLRRDLEWACEEIDDLRIRKMLMQALIDEAQRRLDRVDDAIVVDAASVGAWLDEEGIKLLPWQRKRLDLASIREGQERVPSN